MTMKMLSSMCAEGFIEGHVRFVVRREGVCPPAVSTTGSGSRRQCIPSIHAMSASRIRRETISGYCDDALALTARGGCSEDS